MRLLVFGHWSDTGFGVVTRELSERFLAAGLDVRIIAVSHRGEPVSGPLSGRVWPATLKGDSHGGNLSDDAITGKLWSAYGAPWRPDAVLVISDPSGLFSHMGPKGLTEGWQSVPVFHYCPIEGDNLSVGWQRLWSIIIPVAMSDYGQREIARHIGSAVPRIYHGVDTETFHPVSTTDPIVLDDGRKLYTKAACKALFGLDPDRLLILRTDRYVIRKFYYRLLEALGPVFDQVPEVDLVIHCAPIDNDGTIYDDLARVPERHHERIKLTGSHDTHRGLPRSHLAALMNAADLYVSTTGGEGFGLNLAESLACEVPVVVTDWAADREVVGPGGTLVPPLHDSYGEPVRFHSTYGMDWALPDPKAFVGPIVDLLTHPAKRRSLGREGRHHVSRSFRWDEAAPLFLSLFEDALCRSSPSAISSPISA